MIPRKLLASALLGFAMLALPSPSMAQGASEKAAAEALFDEGVALLKQGKYQEASQRLESSQRIDPGIGTLLYLGEAYEKLGRTASAWATFREAASQAKAAGQTDRAKLGMERADRLTPKLNKVTLQLAPENQGIVGLEILENGASVAQALWGSAIPMDPGEHTLEARAPGYQTYRTQLVIAGESGTQTITLPALNKAPEAAPAPEAAAPAAETQLLAPQPPDKKESDGSLQRTLGLGVAGLGVVGLGVGTFFGVRALDKDSEAEAFCDGTSCNDSRGEDLSSEALGAANVANIAFIAGGVFVVGGLVIYLTAETKSETTAALAEPARTKPRLERIGVRPVMAGGALELGGSF